MRFKHDCPHCVALGKTAKADLYFCSLGGNRFPPTVIARYSDEDSDYASGLIFADAHSDLAEAKERAQAAGLLKRV